MLVMRIRKIIQGNYQFPFWRYVLRERNIFPFLCSSCCKNYLSSFNELYSLREASVFSSVLVICLLPPHFSLLFDVFCPKSTMKVIHIWCARKSWHSDKRSNKLTHRRKSSEVHFSSQIMLLLFPNFLLFFLSFIF